MDGPEAESFHNYGDYERQGDGQEDVHRPDGGTPIFTGREALEHGHIHRKILICPPCDACWKSRVVLRHVKMNKHPMNQLVSKLGEERTTWWGGYTPSFLPTVGCGVLNSVFCCVSFSTPPVFIPSIPAVSPRRLSFKSSKGPTTATNGSLPTRGSLECPQNKTRYIKHCTCTTLLLLLRLQL